MAEYKLGIIGAGNMAEAILRGVLNSGFLPAESILAADVSEDRRQHVQGQLGVTCVPNAALAARCPHVVLAVKPQVMPDVMADIAGAVGPDALVVSIAAGIPTSGIDSGLRGKGRIVRVMPNTPMLVGAGVSAVAAGPRALEADVEWTCDLMGAGGKTVVVEEAMMDAVTAVSGSGPAYFFYLVEAMVAAGVAEGLTEETALELARQTCLGAGKLMADSGEDPAELRRRVTSPNGTTQRAIETMDADDVKDRLTRAVRAAAERSRELGQ